MIKETLQMGDPRLKATNKEVADITDPKTKQIIEDLVDTMHAVGLVGMAAPQIGENYKIFVTEPRETPTRPIDQADELRVYINPKVTVYSKDEVVIYEGCGSVAKGGILFGPVKRPREIVIQAQSKDGTKFELTTDGLLSRVIQHEYDHLSGIVFTERVLDYRKMVDLEFYKRDIRDSSEQKQASMITKKEVKILG
ncbi:peptide deformylase [Candidatus Shapirobacteria bacterium CG03_land_8_20_14_0_80_39_12]|uniref:Peptide deformylase n=1 Tax=Candidatus Shapirobacteria bacterium CG03_land_8_20_14_0_80_39_12 TaxID=1974879 RepID=A0A2M7BDA9_9BACT|nr:MAG: peptide deformylase [Candidatus Shapirobacteria bacterium CG03_land_8_20_14_0_80_39_12]